MAQVLYVDDETDILELVEIHFADKAIPIVTANSALEAEKLVSSHPIKVIISDARMPEIKGTELYLKLKREKNYQGHFILVSGHIEPLAKEVTTQGVSIVLPKPIDFEELIGHVRRLLA